MKKIVTLALLAGISATASAQSSVTLFGILDAAVRQTKNGPLKVTTVSSGGINTSRFGARGIEDLGGGMKAGFWLESGLNVDTGSNSDATRFWNRRATVSLISDAAGELRLGRDFTPTYTGYSDYDPFGDNGVAASGKFDSSLGTVRDTGTRADNQVMYFLPSNLGGVYGRFAVAPGEGNLGKKYYGGRLGYAAGPIDVSGSYGVTYVAPLLGDDKFKTFDLGGSYDFGVAKLLGYYRNSKNVNQKLAVYSIGALVPIGSGVLKANFTHADAKGRVGAAVATVDANDADQYAIGYVYNLSKRTALYTTAAFVKNKGAAAFAVSTPPNAVAGARSSGGEIGIRHAF